MQVVPGGSRRTGLDRGPDEKARKDYVWIRGTRNPTVARPELQLYLAEVEHDGGRANVRRVHAHGFVDVVPDFIRSYHRVAGAEMRSPLAHVVFSP